jgi:hypothetical protein
MPDLPGAQAIVDLKPLSEGPKPIGLRLSVCEISEHKAVKSKR